jgi:predicted phosphodiesterase
MKLTIVSDLHVDINKEPLPFMEGEVLIVAGDTSNSAKRSAKQINELAQNFNMTLCVDGNHEHYNNTFHNKKIDTIANNVEYMRSMLDSSVMLLDGKNKYEIDGYTIIGTNSWYSMDLGGYDPEDLIQFWKDYMNDYRYIYVHGSMNQEYPYCLAEKEAEKIDALITKNTIIVTHTVSHPSMLDDRPWDPDWQKASAFYLNSYMSRFAGDENVVAMINGHTHTTKYKIIGNTEMICNPRGYPNENVNWSPLELDFSIVTKV